MLACATKFGGGSNKRLSCDTDSMVDILGASWDVCRRAAPPYRVQSNDCGLRGATCPRAPRPSMAASRARPPRRKMLEFDPAPLALFHPRALCPAAIIWLMVARPPWRRHDRDQAGTS